MIEVVIDQRRRSIGSFEVGRVLPSAERHMVGPFIFFDHIGPVDLPKGLPRDADVRPHPHIGLSTVRVIDPLRMAVFAYGAETVIEALAPSVLMLLGGDPVG